MLMYTEMEKLILFNVLEPAKAGSFFRLILHIKLKGGENYGTQKKTTTGKFVCHGKAELDAAGFIRAEENDKRTHIKKFAENFTFL